MKDLSIVSSRIWVLGSLLVGAGGCGPDARLSISVPLMPPPLALEMLTVTVREGHRTWQWHGDDFRSTRENATPHTPEIPTGTRGEVEVRFRLQTGDQILSEGTVALPLREDWRWGVDIRAATTDPRLECFGCVGSRAFSLAAAFRPVNRDSIWVVWGGNSISNPVVY
jgi:hypothetical protein